MKRFLTTVLTVILTIVLAAGAAAGFILYRKYKPSKEQVDQSEWYQASGNESAVFLNSEREEGVKGRYIDGQVYLPVDWVDEAVNERFYWDEENSQLIYTLPDQIVYANEETMGSSGKPLLVQQDGTVWLLCRYHMGITAACKGEEEYRAANPGRGKECPDHRSSIRGRGDGSGTAGKLEPGTDGGWPGRVSAEPASERNGSKNSGQHISGAGIHQHLHGRAGGVSMASGDQPFRKSGNADIDICYKRRECDCADLVHADRQQWKLRGSCG